MASPTATSIGLFNGKFFDYLAPDPSVIDLDVLEHGLSIPRFNNQTLRPITVKEHSMRVRRIAVELFAGPAVGHESVELWALLHDAHEALVPWGDCLRPGKTPEMRRIETNVDTAILAALCRDPGAAAAIVHIHEGVRDLVKTADEIALYFEAMLWSPMAIDWAPGALRPIWESMIREHGGVGSLIERFMPLIAPRPRECWRTEVEQLLGSCRKVAP
jgi:hypothetical protein